MMSRGRVVLTVLVVLLLAVSLCAMALAVLMVQ